MSTSRQRPLLFVILAAVALVAAIVSVLLVTRSERDRQSGAPPEENPATKGISFFNVDRTTVLTPDLRDTLAETLGSDAIAHRTPIDLRVVDGDFLRQHLPVLDRLNRAFNPPLGERREHETTRLTYLRAERHRMPFREVELVFSSRSGRPLYFVIRPTADFTDSTATLTAKYGPPRQVAVAGLGDPVRIWERDGDILVATAIVHRNGRISQELRIYFVENLTRLLEAENESLQRRDKDTRRAGEDAF